MARTSDKPRFAMIMAGGAGTRLWPLSREDRPKQLLDVIRRPGDEKPRSLLSLSAGRLEGVVPAERRYICTGERYRGAIRAALPGFADARILGEPAMRDTVNAVGFGAAVFERQNPNAVFAVLTADHLIEPDEEFRRRVEIGFRLVEDDPRRIVTFGITPTYPATGFGYIERGTAISGYDERDATSPGGTFRVARFVEKPDLARAQAYVESGQFLWNAGMFIFSARTFMTCLERYKPESAAGLREIQAAWGTGDQDDVLRRVYPTLPKISVDYAVMEPASKDKAYQICGVAMDVQWLDVGSWPSFGETLEGDASGNRSAGTGSVVAEASRGNLVVVDDPKHTVTLLGCDDLIVVHTPDATLVMPRSKAQDLKDLHTRVDAKLK
ncbi:MAG: mannose-1-phosphate guanylyltransferase [Phycisphaerales bacterium]|jgi:mannose-1-phosphate guanylyltransferase|nr:mannose-1-phosphate guanylyltransferase [Phycisphaerales bacterium]